MKRIIFIHILILISALLSVMLAATDTSTKRERNYIREGNRYYNEKNYSEAEKMYRKALEENENSELAAYNLAVSLIRQSGDSDLNKDNNPIKEASEILMDLSQSAQNNKLAEYASYNLGNITFNQQQYKQSIDLYKNTLRKNPDNDKARQNLRLAQLKLQEQQNQQQNNDKNEENQDQDKKQNKDQNQDKDRNKNEDKKDEQEQGQNKKENKNEQQPPRQEQGSISDANAAKILKTMENEENATRKKINELKKREEQSHKQRTTNQW